LGFARPHLLRLWRLSHPGGVYLRNLPFGGFYAECIIPAEGFAGGHAWVTNGKIAFDYHGYSSRAKLIAHHSKGWCARNPGWCCDIEIVGFDLMETCELNRRKMLRPDQYLHDAVPRADKFIGRIDHVKGATRARSTV
jgi:hypothetical protein